MVKAVRTVERALGEIRFGPTADEESSLIFRRSLFVAHDMKLGEIFTDKNVRSIRPAHGLHTRYLRQILGKRATRNVTAGTPLKWDLIEGQ
jgi:N-acetylneuraminate synthase